VDRIENMLRVHDILLPELSNKCLASSMPKCGAIDGLVGNEAA
jgi:hypothetical protein